MWDGAPSPRGVGDRRLRERTGTAFNRKPSGTRRRQWEGGDNLIVATTHHNADPVFAVDLDGARVPIIKDGRPPEVPTLVLIGAESFHPDGTPYEAAFKLASRPSGPSFSQKFVCDTCSGTGGSDDGDESTEPTGDPRGLDVIEFMSHVRTFNDHEGFFADNAEFTIFLAGTDDTDDGAELDKTINIPSDIWTNDSGWKELPEPLKVAYWRTYGTQVRIVCIERDSGATYSAKTYGETTLHPSTSTEVTVGFEAGVEFTDDHNKCGESYIPAKTTDGEWTYIPDGNDPEWNGTSDLQWYGFGDYTYVN